MAYTEIKARNGRKYYYRAISVRHGARVSKQRKYLGSNLNRKDLAGAEKGADREFGLFEALLTDWEIVFLDRIKLEQARQPPETSQDRFRTFATKFSHNSTAIEDNSLTLLETERLLFEDIAPAGKSFREICEVVGHGRAFDKVLAHDSEISKEFICDLHSSVMKDTISQRFHAEIGRYRTVSTYIEGLDWTSPEPDAVPQEMKKLLSWCSRKRGKLHPLVLAVRFHAEFERVHPFVDGNGRIGRLLMNFILHREGYPMVSIPNVLRYRYHEGLEKAIREDNLRPFLEFMLELLEEDGPDF
jgi:Fic family protein